LYLLDASLTQSTSLDGYICLSALYAINNHPLKNNTMGFYWDTHALYGCPVSPSVKKTRDRLKVKKLGKNLDHLMIDGACFIVLARSKKTLIYNQSGLQYACKRVKMSDLEECATHYLGGDGEKPIKKEDFAVTDEEKKQLAEFVSEFVKPEHRQEALANIGHYMVETFFSTLDMSGVDLIAVRPIAVDDVPPPTTQQTDRKRKHNYDK
jgi:hypothetical protein